jgi:hypothetical protein
MRIKKVSRKEERREGPASFHPPVFGPVQEQSLVAPYHLWLVPGSTQVLTPNGRKEVGGSVEKKRGRGGVLIKEGRSRETGGWIGRQEDE